jgi:peptidylprolyl isomerase
VVAGKRERQKASRQARLAAAAAARRRARRRRLAVSVGAIALVVVATVLLLSARDGGKGAKPASPSTTAAPAAGSAAGKPCVAVSDTLPPGAPAVPVKVGPPPAQLVTEDLKVGTGPPVAAGATVTVNYVGVACSTGKVFDSSYSRNQPATFPLRSVIKGWQEGIPGMHVGGQRLLGIPSDAAYGASGRPPSIAPDEALWFVIEVLDTKP